MPDEHKQAPTTVKEVGIHVGYLREDIGEVKDLLREHIELAATKAELGKLDGRVKRLEGISDTHVTTKQLWGVVGGVTTIIAAIMLIWSFIEKIRG